MKVSVNEKGITTTVWLLLISFYCQCYSLGIVNYHPSARSIPRCQPFIDVSCYAQHREPTSCVLSLHSSDICSYAVELFSSAAVSVDDRSEQV